MKTIYDIDGNLLFSDKRTLELFPIERGYYNGTQYTLINVPKVRSDGKKQFPFVRQPTSTGTLSAYDLAVKEGWLLTINGNVGQGMVIQNSICIVDESAQYHAGALPLYIDNNGDLGYLETDTAGKSAEYISRGIVSVLCGFFPLVVDYEIFPTPEVAHTIDIPTWANAQRQIIGQYSNGDYAIITGEGRNYANSLGLSIEDAQNLCKSLNLKFAYNCDGGGSTQTVIGQKNINAVYDAPTGRKIEAYIVFNGTDTYQIPNGN